MKLLFLPLLVVVAFLLHSTTEADTAGGSEETTTTTTITYSHHHHHHLRQRHIQEESNTALLPDGIWTFRGYGYVIEVQSNKNDDGHDGTTSTNITTTTTTLLEETATSCLMVVEPYLLEGGYDVKVLEDETVAYLSVFRFVPYFVLDRTDDFQAGCRLGITTTTPTTTTTTNGTIDKNHALDVFDVFNQTFVEHFAHFDNRIGNCVNTAVTKGRVGVNGCGDGDGDCDCCGDGDCNCCGDGNGSGHGWGGGDNGSGNGHGWDGSSGGGHGSGHGNGNGPISGNGNGRVNGNGGDGSGCSEGNGCGQSNCCDGPNCSGGDGSGCGEGNGCGQGNCCDGPNCSGGDGSGCGEGNGCGQGNCCDGPNCSGGDGSGCGEGNKCGQVNCFNGTNCSGGDGSGCGEGNKCGQVNCFNGTNCSGGDGNGCGDANCSDGANCSGRDGNCWGVNCTGDGACSGRVNPSGCGMCSGRVNCSGGVNAWLEQAQLVRTNFESTTNSLTDAELVRALTKLIVPLSEYHTWVKDANGDFLALSHEFLWNFRDEFKQQQQLQQQQQQNQQQQQQQWRTYQNDEIVMPWRDNAASYMQDGLTKEAGFAWGQTNESIGYIWLNAVRNDVLTFAFEFEKALTGLNDTEALIIDIRVNPGGSDQTAIQIASYFTSEPYLAFTKQATGGGDVLNVYVEPNGSVVYDKPVVLIISESSYSAAETLSLAMMQLPQVTLLGQSTGGSYSELPKTLPNGWSFSLFSEVYLSPHGMDYDHVGIPPDVFAQTELLPLSERQAGVDSWLELALKTAAREDSTYHMGEDSSYHMGDDSTHHMGDGAPHRCIFYFVPPLLWSIFLALV